MWFFSKKKTSPNISQYDKSLEALWRLLKIMMADLDFDKVVYQVVNGVLTELGYMNLGYRIVVLSLIDHKAGGLRRIALSATEEAKKATSVSTIPFEKIIIPFTATENFGIKAINEKRPLVTSYWPDLLSPILTPEAALHNQQSAGIKTSMVFPVYSREKPIGTLIFSMIKEKEMISTEEIELLTRFSEVVGLAVQNSLLYTSLKEAKDDLTRVNAEVSRVNTKLQDLDKLKDDFLSIASHELRTPMTAIRSYSWMALNRSDVPLSQKVRKYLERTLISTERLINLVNEMLNISRIESGKIEIAPEVFDIYKLLEEVKDEIDVKAKEKNITVEIVASKTPNVYGDPNKIHQVLLNLVGNALKFTLNSGKISLSTFSDGKTVEISVADNGVGIPTEDLSKLFTKFGRLDSSYVAAATSGGTGLGLFICKSLVELMGGKIWARSEGQNKGTIFTFSIPTARGIADSGSYDLMKKRGGAKGLEPVAL